MSEGVIRTHYSINTFTLEAIRMMTSVLYERTQGRTIIPQYVA
jgi:hypothetical protein